jgi:hypothetical protein
MKKEFDRYLTDIGITNTYRERVGAVHQFYRALCPEEITGIFVSEYVTEDGSREYENLWFFSESYCMEAKGFLTPREDNFDMAPIKGRVERWQIKKQEYDFESSTSASRLYLHVDLSADAYCDFKASGENCDYLRDIVLQRIIPNFVA